MSVKLQRWNGHKNPAMLVALISGGKAPTLKYQTCRVRPTMSQGRYTAAHQWGMDLISNVKEMRQ